MDDLTYKTWRARRNVFERLKGCEKMYETKITDGERTAYGRGVSRSVTGSSSSVIPGRPEETKANP